MSDPVVAFLSRLCAEPANRFGPEFLEEHLLVVERFAGQLARILEADETVVRLASLLHDVVAIEDVSQIPVHAERGEQVVADLCGPSGPFANSLRLDEPRIRLVARCVGEHSSPKNVDQTVLESVCVSNADAMSQIARPFYWFHYARAVKGLPHSDALAWYHSLVQRNWSGLMDAARQIVAADYAAVTTLLR